jgi:hypothetical protein
MYSTWTPAIRMVPVSGNGARPSLFTSSVSDGLGFHPTLAGGYWIGQAPEEWYRRAKESLAAFEALLDRTAKIANKTERERILAWVGRPTTEGTPAYRYARVKADLLEDVERYTPPNVDAYKLERRQNRIKELEDFNKEFQTMVSNAETAFGKLPEPVVIEKEKIIRVPGAPAAPGAPDWTLPLIIGGGAVGVALLVTLLFGK